MLDSAGLLKMEHLHAIYMLYIYGQHYSLTRLRKHFFDRRQHDEESIHEHLHTTVLPKSDPVMVEILQTLKQQKAFF